MNKKRSIVFSLLLSSIMLVSSCSRTTTTNLVTSNKLVSTYNNKNITTYTADFKTIADQITANTVSSTEWGTEVKLLPSPQQSKKYTLLSYIAFDNDKGSWRGELTPVLNTHELGASSANLNLVLQVDGAEDNDGKRYYITKDDNLEKIVSPHTKLDTEVNSSDYKVLESFVKWGFSNYKSDVKILDFNTHGASFYGVAPDQASDSKTMHIADISKAITDSVGKVNIMTFDACLMSSLEVAYELQNNVDVMIGSEDATLRMSMLYVKNIHDILENSKTIEDIASNIALSSDRSGVKEIYNRDFQKGKLPNIFTISAIRGGKYINNVAVELNNLSKILLTKMPKYKDAYKVALNGTSKFYVNDDSLAGQRDLYQVLGRINTVIQDQEINNAITKTRDAINKAVVISRANNSEKYAQGIAINISPTIVSTPEYQLTKFAKNTLWDEFIIQTFK